MTIYKNDNAFDTSNVSIENGKVKKYSKTFNSNEFSHIDFGLSIFKKSVFSDYSLNRNFDLSDVFTSLCDDNQLAAFEVKERFYEVGSSSGIRDFSDYLNRSKNVL
jgi:NDP-sugar pyrophosphorylase family protein